MQSDNDGVSANPANLLISYEFCKLFSDRETAMLPSALLPTIKDIRKIFGIFYPLPPLVRILARV